MTGLASAKCGFVGGGGGTMTGLAKDTEVFTINTTAESATTKRKALEVMV
jgi:hypothetical protein